MRLLTGVAAILAMAIPAMAQDRSTLDQDLDKAIDRLYSERFSESEAGRLELVEIGRKAIPRLLVELGKTGGPKDRVPTARVKRNLCEILGQTRDNSDAVITALVGRLNDRDEFGHTVAAAAAGALGAIADDKCVAPLLTALTSKAADTDKWLKYYCIRALGVLRAKDATEAITKALEDQGAAEVGNNEKQHLIAAAAADALGRLRAREATEGLSKLLNKSEVNPYTQQKLGVHAARALERITGISRGSLDGDASTLEASLRNWRDWWNGEETKKNIDKVKGQITEIAAAVEKYKADNSEYPAILDYLQKKPEGKPIAKWPEGGYFKGDLKDPWGTAFVYNTRGDNGAPFDIVSLGKDTKPWGDGDNSDLWNHDAWKAIKVEKTKKNLGEVAAGIAKYKTENGDKLPAKLQDLTVKKVDGGKAILDSVPKDGFDSPFQYQVAKTEGEAYDLISWGSDLKEGGAGTAQDVWNHDKWKAERVKTTDKKLDAIGQAIAKFKTEHERFPEKAEDLKVRPAYVKKWGTQYLPPSEDLKDGFGNAFVYAAKADGSGFDLTSLGADGKEGGEGPDADVSYKKK